MLVLVLYMDERDTFTTQLGGDRDDTLETVAWRLCVSSAEATTTGPRLLMGRRPRRLTLYTPHLPEQSPSPLLLYIRFPVGPHLFSFGYF
jgi:hypothetical protein